MSLGCTLAARITKTIQERTRMAHHIAKQVHDRFKIFSGELAADGTIGKLADEVAAFVNKSKVAAKSIGIAYLEPGNRLVITLGYLDDADPYPVKLHCIPLGKVNRSEERRVGK